MNIDPQLTKRLDSIARQIHASKKSMEEYLKVEDYEAAEVCRKTIQSLQEIADMWANKKSIG